VEFTDSSVDEITFSSILSNALDNAYNAQKELLPAHRTIRVLLKTTKEGKLLLSVKNPYKKAPLIVDGMPVSTDRTGEHGFGTQSIRYLTEQLGGNCRFSLEEGQFVVQVIL
jgi:sensor histidine kinase regulating citrate/malate metabolism